jgi:glycolate oxidase
VDVPSAAPTRSGWSDGAMSVGLLKRGGLEREVAPEVLAMHRAVKAALDPRGILNPGKVFGPEAQSTE